MKILPFYLIFMAIGLVMIVVGCFSISPAVGMIVSGSIVAVTMGIGAVLTQ